MTLRPTPSHMLKQKAIYLLHGKSRERIFENRQQCVKYCETRKENQDEENEKVFRASKSYVISKWHINFFSLCLHAAEDDFVF